MSSSPGSACSCAARPSIAGRLVTRFAKAHRMNCGGACKVGFADVIIGGTMLAAEYIGVEKVPHIQEKIIDMVRLSETSHACAIAAAMRGREEPKGSGVYLPDDLFGNAAKLNIAHGFWEIIKNAGDIGGGLVVTMPQAQGSGQPGSRTDAEEGLRSRSPRREAAQSRQVPPALGGRASRCGHLARRRRPPDPAVHVPGADGLRERRRRWPRSSWA